MFQFQFQFQFQFHTIDDNIVVIVHDFTRHGTLETAVVALQTNDSNNTNKNKTKNKRLTLR